MNYELREGLVGKQKGYISDCANGCESAYVAHVLAFKNLKSIRITSLASSHNSCPCC